MKWDRREVMRFFYGIASDFYGNLEENIEKFVKISGLWFQNRSHYFCNMKHEYLAFIPHSICNYHHVSVSQTHTHNKPLSESVDCALFQFTINSFTVTPWSLAQYRESLIFKAVQTNKWMSSIQNYHVLTCFSAPPGLASQPRSQLAPRGAFFSPIPSVPSLLQICVSQLVRKIPYSFSDSVLSVLPSYVVQQACFWASHYLSDALQSVVLTGRKDLLRNYGAKFTLLVCSSIFRQLFHERL